MLYTHTENPLTRPGKELGGVWYKVTHVFFFLFFHFSGEDEAKVGSQFLTGCLEKIQVQGRDLDLDLAVKHMSISSHSCPA